MKRLAITIEGETFAGRRFEIPSGGLRLGRSSTNDVHIPDEELSRNHCLLEQSGEAGVRITDLASANGTLVNGEEIGAESVELHAGDLVEIGRQRIHVVGDPSAATAVDLGLAKAVPPPAAAERNPVAERPRNLAHVVIGLLVIAALGLGALHFFSDGDGGSSAEPGALDPVVEAVAPDAEAVVELRYERVKADSSGIFRLALDLSEQGELSAELDDMPSGSSRVRKSKQLSSESLRRLGALFGESGLSTLDDGYRGAENDAAMLNSCALTVVFSRHVKSVVCVNADEPAALRRLREMVEAFARDELGLLLLGRSRAELVRLSEESAVTGRHKWEDREGDYGNVYAAVKAYREALYYLESVSPKPPEAVGYREALETAERELERRWRDRLFQADRAINLVDWAAAREELRILCLIVPDRGDDRYRSAAAKLMEVENNLRKEGAR